MRAGISPGDKVTAPVWPVPTNTKLYTRLEKIPVVGLDDRGVRVVQTDVEPTFCTGSTEAEINQVVEDKSLAGITWDIERQKGAKNPAQCETARLYDLVTGKHYRESPGSLLKNIGAGVVNSIIPGSDLGDRGSSTQMVGALIGGVASIGAGSAGIIGSLTKTKDVSTFSNIINAANGFLTSPLGQIGSTVLQGLIPKGVSGTIQPAVAGPGQMKVSPLVPGATLIPGWGVNINTSTKIPAPVPITQPYGTTTTTTKESIPSWVYLVIAAVVGFMLLKKK